MTEPSSDDPPTLATRLEDAARSVTERDLQLVTDFLYETLGRWYELKPGGRPPSVEPVNVIVKGRAATVTEPLSPSPLPLLDPGDELIIAEREPGADPNPDSDVDPDPKSDVDPDSYPDERDGVLVASTTLAQVALGRTKHDDETWDAVVQHLETEQRPSLASALWVGLATEREVRYRTLGQWRRSIDAALRSDAATATMFDGGEPRIRKGLVMTAAVVAVAAAAAGFMLFGRDTTSVEDATATTEPSGPVTTDGGEPPSTTTTATEDVDAGSVPIGGDGDGCSTVGPLGPITVDQVSDTAIVVSWSPSTEAVNITLDGAFVDTVPAEAFRYVIERLPLSAAPLTPDTDYVVAVEPQSGEPSTACATTLSNPVPGSEVLIGVASPTGLEVIDTSATSITVSWDPRPGADQHNLYLDGTYIQFGDVGGSSTVGDETEFTFLDLEPDTS